MSEQEIMFKRNIVPFLYCVFIPLLTIGVLVVVPEFSLLVSDESTPSARAVRAIIAIWLIWVYIGTGISFIPNLDDSQVKVFRTWNQQHFNRFRNKNDEPLVSRSFFPMYFFIPIFIVCTFAGFIYLLALSTFIELSITGKIIIVGVNVLLLFLPRFALYNKTVIALYGELR